MGKHDSVCLVKNTTVSELEFCLSRIIRPDDWNFRRDGDETSLERTGIRRDTREPRRQPICKGMGIQTRFGTDGTCNAEVHYMFVQDVVEKKQTTLACANTNSNKADLMTKCHTFEAHTKGCAMLGLKLSRDDDSLETVTVT